MSPPGFVGRTDTVLFTDWNNSPLLKRSVHTKVCSFYHRNIWQFSSGMFQVGGLLVKLMDDKAFTSASFFLLILIKQKKFFFWPSHASWGNLSPHTRDGTCTLCIGSEDF